MSQTKNIDHLFRHQHGKMVSILTRVFGLQHLELIEDAVQDTFISAMKSWRNGLPDDPEAWLTTAAKNRVLDLFRKMSADNERHEHWTDGKATTALNDLFLDAEIADSQLRMIFAACNPNLKPQDQIAFALKTISGFSATEISSALLLKEETVKKRLTRARQVIAQKEVKFNIPVGTELPHRLHRVLEVVYLIFNEGFHSGKKDALIREDLCGEAMRLCKLILTNKHTASGDTYALFALMCFHTARLRSKTDEDGEAISLKDQDRRQWYPPLIELGYQSLQKAMSSELGIYHFEAAIAGEHVMAKTYADTNWDKIVQRYESLQKLQPSSFTQMNLAMAMIEAGQLSKAKTLIDSIDPNDLEQRAYLYHGLCAEYHLRAGSRALGLKSIDRAIDQVRNDSERKFLLKKRAKFLTDSNG